MKKQPIKRNENIIKLSKEHHFTLLFCWKIRQGLRHEVGKERMITYARFFWDNYLKDHFREEESILFAPIEDEQVKKAVEDHRQIKQQLDGLGKTIQDDVKRQLMRLADIIDDHIRYEERILFPHLEKMLNDEQLEAIGKQLTGEQFLPPKDAYADEFWIKK